ERAADVLAGWHQLMPQDHWPLVRQAILEQERGNAERRAAAVDRALGLTRGPLRAAVAFLGARLALRQPFRQPPPQAEENGAVPALTQARQLLEECLREDPGHVEALWHLAAVRSAAGDQEALASQAAVMNRPDVRDARFHYLGAVCNIAAGEY